MKNVLEFLERSAKRYPGKMAVSDENECCTYDELRKDARRIGSKLAEYSEPRNPIAVLAKKQVKTVKTFMGIVYAGCFYVYIDPSQPQSRLEKILETLDGRILIVDDELQEMAACLKGTERMAVLCLETLFEDGVERTELLSKIQKQALDVDPLYAIFTSGSTGVPKGVLVGHRSVIDFVNHFVNLFHITEQDVIGNQAPFDFDVSVKDLYSSLCVGASLELIPKKFFSIPTALLDYLCDRKITTAIWAVSALCMITSLNGFSYRIPESLNKILFSGEVMPVKHLKKWQEALPNAMFVNLYGPTEITCNCTYYVVDRIFEPGERIPIGNAFPNEKVFLLDTDNKEVTQTNQIGEVCVAGTALALGYYNDPVKTQEVFVQNPLNNRFMEIIYRTGDLAHYGADGLLYFDTRKDFQIKHMGHRIELGEIETAMGRIDGVERVCCVFDEKKSKIIAYYEGNADKKKIAEGLAQWLPRYMYPNRYMQTEKFPLTKNGKIDREVLKKQYESATVHGSSAKV